MALSGFKYSSILAPNGRKSSFLGIEVTSVLYANCLYPVMSALVTSKQLLGKLEIQHFVLDLLLV